MMGVIDNCVHSDIIKSMHPKPHPSQARLKELFHYCPETGIFTSIADRKRWKAGRVAGTLAKGYVQINIDRSIYRAHRLAWIYMTGEHPEQHIDHIDRNPANNAWSNLRLATDAQNLLNRGANPSSRLGVKGVRRSRRNRIGYIAQIKKNGKVHYLGCFKTIEEAKAAYDAAGRILHGEFFHP